VSSWKVILATLIIFAAGVFTGGLVVKDTRKAPPRKEPQVMRTEMLRRLTRELQLTPEQRTKVDAVLQESNERTKILRELLQPELQAEYRKAVDDITAELTPEQHKKLDDLLKQRRKQTTPAEKRRQQHGQPAVTNKTQTF
jgi:hypothetical protein